MTNLKYDKEITALLVIDPLLALLAILSGILAVICDGRTIKYSKQLQLRRLK